MINRFSFYSVIKIHLLFVFLLISFQSKLYAQRNYANGNGTGKLQKGIFWLTWNSESNSNLISKPAGSTASNVKAGTYIWQLTPSVKIVAELSNIYGSTKNDGLSCHTPSSYSEGLSSLYPYIGTNTGIPDCGLQDIQYSSIVGFNVSVDLQMKINGVWQSITYPGMVVGDAETLAIYGTSNVEYIKATLVDNNASWQLLDFHNGAWNASTVAPDYLVTVTDGGMTFVDSMKYPYSDLGLQAVMYAKNATSLMNVETKGAGETALALGIVAPFDFGDAPASYGYSGHYFDTVRYNNIPPLVDSIYPAGIMPQITITPFQKSLYYLGSNNTDFDGNPNPLQDTTAAYDNAHENNDEDGFNLATQPSIGVNNSSDVKLNVKATNAGITTATIYAWIDFNRDGHFSAKESAIATLPPGSTDLSVPLTFTLKHYKSSIKAGPTYARFRITTTPLGDATDFTTDSIDDRSINIALDGETEDYKLKDIVIGKAAPVGVDDLDSTYINKNITTNVKSNDGASNLKDTVKISSAPTSGKAIINGNGTITYSPSNGFTGKDLYTYTLTTTDTTVSEPITVTILVKPIGIKDLDTTPINTPITINVKANDSAKGGSNQVLIFASPKNGTVKVNLDGTITYTPKTLFVGNDTLTYSLMTADSVYSNPVFVYLNVFTPKADVIIKKLLNTKGILFIGKTVSFSLIVTNNGPDSATGVIALDTIQSILSNISNISTINGTVSFVPATSILNWNIGTIQKNQIDTLTFTAKIVSGTSLTNGAIVNGNEIDPDTSNNKSKIAPVAILVIPSGVKDIDSTVINTPVITNVKVNDGKSASVDTIKLSSVPKNGTVSINSDSTISYSPNLGFTGKDTFSYTLTSPDSLVSSPVWVVILVKPLGVTDIDTTPMNTPITLEVKANDSAKGGNNSVSVLSKPKNGLVLVNPDGTITYNPISGFVGNDTLSYTLMTNDSVYSLSVMVYLTVYRPRADLIISKLLNTKGTLVIGKSVSFSLIVSNNGPDSATGVFVLDTLASNLSAVTNITSTKGTATYLPTSSSISWNIGLLKKNQLDTLTFSAQILNGISLTNSANVKGSQADPDSSNNKSTISPVAIAPIPVGLSDIDSTIINKPVITNLKQNDGLSEALDTVKIVTLPLKGTATLNPDGTVTYQPNPNFTGKDTFTYLLINKDSVVSKPVSVTILVKPVGVKDVDTTLINIPITINVKANDSAKGGNDMVAVMSKPNHGVAIINPDGTVTYNPTNGFVGNDTLSYTLMTPDSVSSAPIFVYLTVIKPKADLVITKVLNTKGNLVIGKTVSFSLIITNNGPDSATGVIALDTLSSNLGAATNITTANGTASYFASSTSISWNVGLLKKNQQDTLTFSASILSGVSLVNSAIVKGNESDPDTNNNRSTITPVSIKPIPTGVPDIDSTLMNTPVTTTVKSNDGTPVILDTVKVATPPNNGKALVNSDGTIVYTPNSGFNGKDTYTYTLTSPDSIVSAPVVVTVFVKPIGVNDLDSTTINKPVITNVKLNDGTNVSKDTVKIATNPKNGTTTVNINGTVTYIPNPGFAGKDQFTYTLITPDSVISSPITAVIYVKPVGVNDRDTTLMNVPIKVVVKNNDSAKGGNNIIILNATTKNGVVKVNPDSTITYSPNIGFFGQDTCSYLLMTPDSVFSAPINVYLTVYKPKADIVITKVLNSVLPIVVGQKVAFTLTVTNNGPDSATGIIALDTLAFNLGVATNITASNGNATYNNIPSVLTWNIGGLGLSKSATLTFTSQILGGVSFINTARVTANESDPDTTNNRSTIPLVQFAAPPKGVADIDTTSINTPKVINVKANDGLTELNDTVKVATNPLNGIAVVNNGTIVYTPISSFVGKDSLTYTLTQPNGLVSPPIKVYVLVLPAGVNDLDSTEKNTSVTTAILKNDGPSSTVSSPVLVVPPSKGKVVFNGNGTVTYIPDSNFVGVDTYQYVLITNSGLISEPIIVSINVTTPKPKSCDLEIVKELTTSGGLYVGETIGFSITVTNNGPNDATGIIAEDLYPKNLSKPKNLLATVGSAIFIDSTKTIKWIIGGLASGQVTQLNFNAVIDSGTVLNNSAAVLGNQPDPDLTNNHSSIQQTEVFPAYVFIPNVITPNGDGKNDKFIVLGLGRYPNTEISIFNRWDNLVYHSSNYNNDWDGSGLNTGTYYYVIKMPLPTGGIDVKKGWVMLLK